MKTKIEKGQITYVGFDEKNNDCWLIETRGNWTYVNYQENEFTQLIVGYVVKQKDGTYQCFQFAARNIKCLNTMEEGIEYIKSLKK